MAYNTLEVFKRNLFSKTKKDREITKKLNKLEKQLKNNKGVKGVYTYGKKKFKTRESAQAYFDKINNARMIKAAERFGEVQAKHELQRLDRAIKKGKNLKGIEATLKIEFPEGILGKKSFYKKDLTVSYSKILEQLYLNYYNYIGGTIIAIGNAADSEKLKAQGSVIYSMSKTGLLKEDDYEAILILINSVSSKERTQEPFLSRLIALLDDIFKRAFEG